MASEKRQRKLSTTQLILVGFLAAILVGSVLLTLPVSSATGQATAWVDALFTAATSVCVTGLTVVDTYAHWSIFGKVIILLLIQLGGLGIISFTTGLMVLIGRKITLKDRLLLESAFNLDTLDGLLRFLGKVFQGTLVVESAGMLLCLPVFVPQFGWGKGIWVSLFHAVSAFCNAGIDILGPDSLIPYATNLWLNLVTMVLIVLGGLGFIVWWDLLRLFARIRRGELRRGQYFRSLQLHTKITLTATAVLLAGGWLLFALLEWTNPETLGQLSPAGRVLASLFQSVTTRTAGFASIPQSELRGGSVLLCVVLMFIGGSSVSTAGGVKTSTVALLFLSARSVVLGRNRVTAFRRTIPERLVRRASAVVCISLVALLGCTILLSVLEPGEFSDLLYETASALGTAGLTRGVSAQLGVPGKLLLTCCMYLGRVGPISLAIAFANRKGSQELTFPERNITIG
jgi:trk system potassium uptake protein TrkH